MAIARMLACTHVVIFCGISQTDTLETVEYESRSCVEMFQDKGKL